MREQELAPKQKAVVVSVNGHDVEVPHKLTGEELKAAAIEQGVPIEEDFVLFVKHGTDYDQITDDQQLTVHKGEEFRALAPDDVA
jgi:hypothetical protein